MENELATDVGVSAEDHGHPLVELPLGVAAYYKGSDVAGRVVHVKQMINDYARRRLHLEVIRACDGIVVHYGSHACGQLCFREVHTQQVIHVWTARDFQCDFHVAVNRHFHLDARTVTLGELRHKEHRTCRRRVLWGF